MGHIITAGKLVELKYTMQAEDGKVLDTTGDETEKYLHGSGAIVVGLERALEGKQAGDRVDVLLEPADAFGERKGKSNPQPVPRATFPADADLRVGMKFQAETPDGQPMSLFITRVEEHEVFVDATHPHAGIRLRFVAEVVAVEDAS